MDEVAYSAAIASAAISNLIAVLSLNIFNLPSSWLVDDVEHPRNGARDTCVDGPSSEGAGQDD